MKIYSCVNCGHSGELHNGRCEACASEAVSPYMGRRFEMVSRAFSPSTGLATTLPTQEDAEALGLLIR